MCGRYSLFAKEKDYLKLFGVAPQKIVSRYNIAPQQDLPIIKLAENDGKRVIEPARWGLIPFWAKNPKVGYKMINARAESVAVKPSFRQAIAKRRCLVPTNGFFEWKTEGKAKQPYFIHLSSNKLFAFAGIFETWASEHGEVIESFCILTTDAKGSIKKLHDRMPVILPKIYYDSWLNVANIEGIEIMQLIAKANAVETELHPVNKQVGKASFDDPACIEPLDV